MAIRIRIRDPESACFFINFKNPESGNFIADSGFLCKNPESAIFQCRFLIFYYRFYLLISYFQQRIYFKFTNVRLSVRQVLGETRFSPSPNKIELLFSVQIPLIHEHLFYKYFVVQAKNVKLQKHDFFACYFKYNSDSFL